MTLVRLAGDVVLKARFRRVVDAYSEERANDPATTHMTTHTATQRDPQNEYSLVLYGNVPVIATGLLMGTDSRISRFLERFGYGDGCKIKEEQLPHLHRLNAYFRPMLIKSDDGRINWVRSEFEF